MRSTSRPRKRGTSELAIDYRCVYRRWVLGLVGYPVHSYGSSVCAGSTLDCAWFGVAVDLLRGVRRQLPRHPGWGVTMDNMKTLLLNAYAEVLAQMVYQTQLMSADNNPAVQMERAKVLYRLARVVDMLTVSVVTVLQELERPA